jgi:uncharacterized protein YrrD
MNSKHLKGLAVISIADGAKLGTIDDIYLDPAAKRVVGFSVAGGSVGGAPDAGLTIDATEVHTLGQDALTLADMTSPHGAGVSAAYGSLALLEDLAKRKVVTEGGTHVGQVASVEFDEQTFALTQVEVSPGFFRTNRSVTADQLVSIGEDVVVVADAVLAEAEPATTGATGVAGWETEGGATDRHRDHPGGRR